MGRHNGSVLLGCYYWWPDKLRFEQPKSIKSPTLVVQGERDPFGNIDEVAGYPLSSQIQMHWLTDGDHSFKPRKVSGKS